MTDSTLKLLDDWERLITHECSDVRQQQDNVLAEIKKAQANPIPLNGLQIPVGAMPIGRVPRYPIDCPRFSPSGKLIGWYPSGQQRGRPIRLSPIQRMTRAFLKSLRGYLNYGDEPPTAKYRSRMGVAKRQANSKAIAIVARWHAITLDGSVSRGLPKRLAREFGCDPNYVRRVLRMAKSGPTSRST